MRRLATKLTRRLAGEGGFTLVELLMASVLGLFVVGIATTVFVAAVRSQPGLTARDDHISQARTTVERLVRELRQGRTVYTSTASQLTFLTYVPNSSCGAASSGFCRVTYNCAVSGSTATCTRTEANPDGSSGTSPYTVATGLGSANVFSYLSGSSGTNFITISFPFPGQNGGAGIKVTDGAALRNSGTS